MIKIKIKKKVIKVIVAVAIGWVIPLAVMGQSSGQNYILTRTMTAASAYFDDIQYYDGLGRPVETVQKQYTPESKDLVSRTEYDPFGREYRQWLPAPNTKSDGTYNGSSASFYGDTYPYSETVYEPSPLNRIQNRWGPGVNWRTNGRKVTIEYLTNKSGDSTLICPNYYGNGTNSFAKSSDYATGQLYVTKTTDEDGKVSYEFKDKSGRVLLQRRMDGNVKYDTNYVYDDFENLVFVLPPVASDALTTAQTYSYWNTYNSIYLPNLVYSFSYNERNLNSSKVIPGVDVENFIYDTADRLVMDQTATIQIPNGTGGRGWLFNKYDALGRIILSGIYTGDDAGTKDANTRAYDMKIKFQTILSKESASASSADYYYTWNTFPAKAQADVTRVYFYDVYTNATDNAGNSGSLGFSTKTGYGTQYSSAKGLLTGTWDKLSDGSGWVKTTYYYDAFGNLVQKRSTNNKGGYDYEYYAYNYNNQATKKYTEHAFQNQSQITEEYSYYYGKRLRLDSVRYKINTDKEINLASYQYDNVGRVKEKKTGGKETAAFSYNVRSWETGQAGQRFSENLYYESGHPKSGAAVYYGGNVSAWTWKPESATVRGYSFKYNALGWITEAAYGEGTGLAETLKYDENITEYDKNGNIKKLKRNGRKDNGTFGLIDNLSMTEYAGNMVRKITDAAGMQNGSDVMEFKKNYSGTAQDYYYGSNGALSADYNKNICMIKYNYLNLPKSVQFRKGDRIEYVYDAAGVRRQTTRKAANRDLNYGWWDDKIPATADFDTTKTVTTNYFGNKVYVNNQLKYVLTEEGYMEKAAGGNTFNAFYYLNDHLGSRRIVMDASGTVKQVNNYYPSGTAMAEARTDQGVQPYKFSGKELDRTNAMDFYDFDARTFDPVLMRFWSPDPMAAKYFSISPFAYCANNPVRYIDPTGMDITIRYITGYDLWRNPIRNGSWTFTGTNQDKAPSNQLVQDFLTAYNYNVGNGGGESMYMLANSRDMTVTLTDAAGSDNNHNASFIRWDSRIASKTKEGYVESPATSLEHEMAHALDYLSDPDYSTRKNTPDNQYGNQEERWVITGAEAKTGQANGEYPQGYVRSDHVDHGDFWVSDPTKRAPMPPPQQEPFKTPTLWGSFFKRLNDLF